MIDLTICPYCGKKITKTTGEKIYPHRKDLYYLTIWECTPCNAYVGSHKATREPLGTVATGNLRDLRIQAHSVVDPYWKKGKYSRIEVYKFVSAFLLCPPEEAHIAMLNEADCKYIIDNFYIPTKYKKENKIKEI